MADITNQIQNYEKYYGLRQRRRRATDQTVFEETISAICCDLIHRLLENPGAGVAVSLSHRILGRSSRYRAPALGKTLPEIIDYLSAPEMAFVEVAKGHRELVWEDAEDGGEDRVYWKGSATILTPGEKLLTRIRDHELCFEDLGRSESEEIIILRGKKRNGKRGALLEYDDGAATIEHRRRLREINRWLEDANITFLQDASDGVGVDPFNRRLRRVFNNGSFHQGGRLWGGFWQDVKKAVRRSDLLIEGQSAVELDYGQMALRLLYGKVGAKPPTSDLYRVPGLERHRDGVKKLINSALFTETAQTRMPQGTRPLFPNNIRYADALAAICRHHAPIAEYLFKGVGMELMSQESEIIVGLLLALKGQGVVALPIHDSVLVPTSAAPLTRCLMEEVFLEMTGVEAEVSVVGGG